MDHEQLKNIIERIEKLNTEADAIRSDIRELYNQAKAAGYEPKYIRQMIKLRKLDKDELDEQDELTQMYRTAIGL